MRSGGPRWGRGGARQTSFSPTARACCVRMDLLGFPPPPPPGSLQGRTRCYQNTIHYGSDSSSWDPALLDLRGISVLAREKKGMWKRKTLGRMKERRGDSSRPDAEGREGGEDETQRDETESLTFGMRCKVNENHSRPAGPLQEHLLKVKICFMQCRRSYFKTSLPSNKLLVTSSIRIIKLPIWNSS